LWAVGTLLALVTIVLLVALLVVNLDAVKWEALLSRERIKLVALYIGIAVALTTLFVLLAIGGASLGWTGFADKTLWEWLQLLGALAIPLVLALAGFWFTSQQEQSAQVVEEQRAQDAALQVYLDQMGTLLLTEGLRKSEEGSEVRLLARARTITVLGRFDPKRKSEVMRFLVETSLVQRVEKKGAPLISLRQANLSGANLTSAPLMDADLNEANLSEANLLLARMSHADLSFADLRYANLRYANLRYANLSGEADSISAILFEADQSGADLRDADLSGANLSGANLRDAYLIGADGVSKEMLEQQTKFLSNTTMPDGTVIFGEFEPPLSLNPGGDWYISEEKTPDSISISGPESGQLLFTNSLQVFDPSKPSEPKELSEPENVKEWVAWFQRNPNLDTSKPLPVRVGSK
jgi:hypothetical protein